MKPCFDNFIIHDKNYWLIILNLLIYTISFNCDTVLIPKQQIQFWAQKWVLYHRSSIGCEEIAIILNIFVPFHFKPF